MCKTVAGVRIPFTPMCPYPCSTVPVAVQEGFGQAGSGLAAPLRGVTGTQGLWEQLGLLGGNELRWPGALGRVIPALLFKWIALTTALNWAALADAVLP